MNAFVSFNNFLCFISITVTALCYAAEDPNISDKKRDAAEAAEEADHQRGVAATVLAECMTKKGELTPWEKEIRRLGSKYFGQFKSKNKEDLAKKIYQNFDKVPHKDSLEIYSRTHMPKEAIDAFNNKK